MQIFKLRLLRRRPMRWGASRLATRSNIWIYRSLTAPRVYRHCKSGAIGEFSRRWARSVYPRFVLSSVWLVLLWSTWSWGTKRYFSTSTCIDVATFAPSFRLTWVPLWLVYWLTVDSLAADDFQHCTLVIRGQPVPLAACRCCAIRFGFYRID